MVGKEQRIGMSSHPAKGERREISARKKRGEAVEQQHPAAAQEEERNRHPGERHGETRPGQVNRCGEEADGERAEPSVHLLGIRMKASRQEDTEGELRQSRDKHRSETPFIDEVMEHEKTDQTDREGDATRCREHRNRSPLSERVPKNRIDQIELNQEPDVPPRGSEVIEEPRGGTDAKKAQIGVRVGDGDSEAGESPCGHEYEVRCPPRRVHTLSPAPVESEEVEWRVALPTKQPPRQSKSTENEKEPDALVACPADVAEQVQGNAAET